MHTTRTMRFLAVAMAAALVLGACGDDDDDSAEAETETQIDDAEPTGTTEDTSPPDDDGTDDNGTDDGTDDNGSGQNGSDDNGTDDGGTDDDGSDSDGEYSLRLDLAPNRQGGGDRIEWSLTEVAIERNAVYIEVEVFNGQGSTKYLDMDRVLLTVAGTGNSFPFVPHDSDRVEVPSGAEVTARFGFLGRIAPGTNLDLHLGFSRHGSLCRQSNMCARWTDVSTPEQS